MKIAEKVAETSNEPPSFRRRFLAKALPVFVFGFFFPALLFFIPKYILDRTLGFQTFLTPVVRALLGGSLITLGTIFIFLPIRSQRIIGKGTPMPLMATQKLVTQGLYRYCRNPIYFGVVSLFYGISVLFDSISSLVMVSIFSVTILLFARFIEENELEKRFGDVYLAYKEDTPFFIPTPPILRRNK